MKKIVKLQLGILAFLLCNFSTSFGQQADTLHLSLDEAIQKAIDEGWESQIAKKDIEIAQAEYSSTAATYLPKITLSETGIFTTSPLQAFGILLNQEIVESSDFNPISLNDPDVATNFNTRLSVEQPIFNKDASLGRQASENQILAKQFMQKRVSQQISLQVKRVYYSLQLASESFLVIQKAIDAAKANEALTQKNLEQGLVQKADLMNAQLRVLSLENQLLDIKNQFHQNADQLKYFLNLPTKTTIKPSDPLRQPNPSALLSAELSEQRSDFKAQKFAIQAQEKILQSHKKGILPRLNAFGAFELNDNIPFGTGAGNWLLGFTLQWNIFNGYDRIAKIQKSKVELEKSELAYQQNFKQNQVELEKAKRQAKLMLQKLKTSELAINQSKEILRIRRDRYEQGLEKTNDILIAETQVAEKELAHLQNLYALNLAIFHLEFLQEK